MNCSVCGNGTCETGEDPNNCPSDCSTSGCAHDPCQTGGALEPDCDQVCVPAVCLQDPVCCLLTWDADCVVLAQGVPFCGC
jgi:hypothetical protein